MSKGSFNLNQKPTLESRKPDKDLQVGTGGGDTREQVAMIRQDENQGHKTGSAHQLVKSFKIRHEIQDMNLNKTHSSAYVAPLDQQAPCTDSR